MSKRQIQIATAAAPVFIAKGFRRTSMSDIAVAAGISRQALYSAFKSKDDAFSATCSILFSDQFTKLVQGVEQLRDLRARLEFACEQWVAYIFDLKRSTPDAADMDDISFPAVLGVYESFARLIGRLLEEGSEGELPSEELADLARIIVYGIRGYAEIAVDAADMRHLVSLHIDLVVRQIDAARSSAKIGKRRTASR